MSEFIAQVVNGLAIGSVYALVALGFVLVFGVAKVVNFAQGSQVMAGAYLVWAGTQWGLPLPVAFVVAVAGSVVIALVIDLVAVEWLGRAAEIAPLLSTLALAFAIDQLVRLVFSPNPVPFPNPVADANVQFGSMFIGATDVIVLGTTVVFMVAFAILLKHTWIGRAVRAAAQDSDAAQQVGVHTRRAKLIVFAASGFLGALGGLLIGMYFRQIDPSIGLPFGLKGFAAAVVGGVASLPGGVAGGLVIGVFESLSGAYLGSEYRDLVAFALLLVILIVRPQGIFGSRSLLGLGGARGAGALPTTSPLADDAGYPVTVMGSRRIPMRWTLSITAAIGLAGTVLVGNYWSGVFAQGAIFATAALGMMVLTGMVGYVSIGHGALMGIGAYACARITTDLGWPIEAVLIAVIVLSMASGLLFALPLLRLSGHVMALATLALGQIGYLVMLNWMPVTRGPMGIGGIPEPIFAVLGGTSMRFPGSMTAIAFVVLMLGLGVVHLLSRGQLARNLAAIREDRLAAEASGVVASPHLIVAFVASSVVTGLAGMMFAYQQSYVSPDSFLILTSFLMLTMVLVGGVISPLGAVVGSILLIALPELLREYSEYRDVVYAVILILIIKYLPSGITSIRFSRRSPHRSASGRESAPPPRTEQSREAASPRAAALPQDSVIPASEAARR